MFTDQSNILLRANANANIIQELCHQNALLRQSNAELLRKLEERDAMLMNMFAYIQSLK